MSRAYRITVRETDRQVLTAGDAVGTCLGLLEVLPAEEMAALLEKELTGLGFRKDGELLRRDTNGVTATVNPKTGDVTVRAEVKAEVELSSIREGLAYDDVGPNAKNVNEKLREQAKQDLQRQADHERNKLQREATKKLEGQLCDLKPDLDRDRKSVV